MRIISYFLLVSVAWAHSENKEESKESSAPSSVTSSLTIPVKCDTNEKDFIPKAWSKGKTKVSAVALEEQWQQLAKKTIDEELAKYPKKMLDATLKSVKLVKELHVLSACYGGTYDNYEKCIFIALPFETNCYPDFFYFRRTLHHELSSLFLKQFEKKFPKDEWLSANPKNYVYPSTTGSDAVASGKGIGTNLDDETAKLGFINEYGKNALEEDFNTIAEYTMADPTKMHEMVERFPRIKKKHEILVKFYKRIDPNFVDPLSQIDSNFQ